MHFSDFHHVWIFFLRQTGNDDKKHRNKVHKYIHIPRPSSVVHVQGSTQNYVYVDVSVYPTEAFIENLYRKLPSTNILLSRHMDVSLRFPIRYVVTGKINTII